MSPRSKLILDIVATVSVLAFPALIVIGGISNCNGRGCRTFAFALIADILPFVLGMLWIVTRNAHRLNRFASYFPFLQDTTVFRLIGIAVAVLIMALILMVNN